MSQVLEFVKSQYFPRVLKKDKGWLTACMKRLNVGRGDYVRCFFPEEVDELNQALQTLSEDIISRFNGIPDTHSKDNRDFFATELKRAFEYVKTATFYKVAGIKPNYWTFYTTMRPESYWKYMTADQIKKFKMEAKRIANFIADIHLVYEYPDEP